METTLKNFAVRPELAARAASPPRRASADMSDAAALRAELERLKAQNAALKASEDEPQAKATATPEVGGQPSANATSAPNADPNKPCDNYRVDMAAANFGDCKCGFPKKDHAPSAFASRGGAKPAGQTVAPPAGLAAALRRAA